MSGTVHPNRWALLVFVVVIAIAVAGGTPYLSVRLAQERSAATMRDNHRTNCLTQQHEWDVLDALIIKVDAADPGVRAQYEPVLGRRPVC